MANLPDDRIERAGRVLADDPSVIAVYAFGSRARGEARADSDYDLAVRLQRSYSLQEELRLRSRVVEELGTDAVDLVVLNRARPELRYEILSHGRRLYARDDAEADGYERRAALEYFDTAHLRSVQESLAREVLE